MEDLREESRQTVQSADEANNVVSGTENLIRKTSGLVESRTDITERDTDSVHNSRLLSHGSNRDEPTKGGEDGPRRPDPRDHGYAWVIVLLSVTVVFTMYSTWAGFGVYLTEFAYQFPEDKAYLALLFSVQNVATGITGVFGGTFIELCGNRLAAVVGVFTIAMGFLTGAFSTNIYHLVLTYGLTIGVGNSLTLMSATIATQQYFDKKRGLANGLILAGGSLAIFSISPIVAYITDNFGWRAAFIMQSGLALQAMPFAMLLRPLPVAKNTVVDKRPFFRNIQENIRHLCHCNLLKNKTFTILQVGTFLFYFAHETPFLFNVSRAMNHGIPRQDASFVMSALAVTSFPARVMIGWIGDKTHRGVLVTIAVLLAGACHLFSILCRNLTSHLVYGSIYGLFAGGFVALISPTIVDVVGVEYLSASQGIYMFVLGSAGIGGPVFSNLLVELTSDYRASYVMAGTVCLSGGLLIGLSTVLSHRRKKRRSLHLSTAPPGEGGSSYLTGGHEPERLKIAATSYLSLQSLGH